MWEKKHKTNHLGGIDIYIVVGLIVDLLLKEYVLFDLNKSVILENYVSVEMRSQFCT